MKSTASHPREEKLRSSFVRWGASGRGVRWRRIRWWGILLVACRVRFILGSWSGLLPMSCTGRAHVRLCLIRLRLIRLRLVWLCFVTRLVRWVYTRIVSWAKCWHEWAATTTRDSQSNKHHDNDYKQGYTNACRKSQHVNKYIPIPARAPSERPLS